MQTKDIKDQAENTMNTARDFKDRAEGMLHDSWETIQSKTADMQENAITYIKKNPMKSIGFAALAGIILAQLLRGHKE